MEIELQDFEECKGCLDYISGLCYDMRRVSDLEQCPCKKCLIKSMCKEICDDFIKYDRNRRG